MKNYEDLEKLSKTWNIVQIAMICIQVIGMITGIVLIAIPNTAIAGFWTIFSSAIFCVLFMIFDKCIITIIRKMYDDYFNSLSEEDRMRKCGIRIIATNDDKDLTIDRLLNGETIHIPLEDGKRYFGKYSADLKLIKEDK